MIVERNLIDTWALLNSIFVSDNPISRSQYYDCIKSNKLHIPEIRLWIDVLQLVVNDWLAYAKDPIPENYKVVRDVEEWAFRESRALSLIADAIYLAFQMDPEVFKRKFRIWIRQVKPIEKPAIPAVASYVLTEPFESMEILNDLVGCTEDT